MSPPVQLLLLVLLRLASDGSTFTIPLGRRRPPCFSTTTTTTIIRLASSGSDDDDDDASTSSGDGSGGDGELLGALSTRLDEVREKQQAADRNIAKNWRGALWSVRGMVMRDVQLSQVVLSGSDRMAVGTADGLVYAIDVGTERIAEFSRMDSAAADSEEEAEASESGDSLEGAGDGGDGDAAASFQAYKARVLRRPPTESIVAMETASRDVDEAMTQAAEGSEPAQSPQSEQPAPLIREDEYKADHDYDKSGSPYKIVAEYGGPLGGVHDGPVTALVWDGSVLISGGQDGTVGVWRNTASEAEGRKGEQEAFRKAQTEEKEEEEEEEEAKEEDDEEEAKEEGGEDGASGGSDGSDDIDAAPAADDDGASAMLKELRELRATMDHVSAIAADASHAEPPDTAEQMTLPLHLFQAGKQQSSEGEAGSSTSSSSSSSPIIGVAPFNRGRSRDSCLIAVVAASGRLTLWDANAGKEVSRPVMVPVPELDDAAAEFARNGAGRQGSLASPFAASSLAVLDDLGVVAVGTSEGRVVCYALDALLASAEAADSAPAEPLYSFRAHEPGISRAASEEFNNPIFCGSSLAGVTAMFSAPASTSPYHQGSGDMAMDPSLPGATVLLTGGADGVVKQWELFNSAPTTDDDDDDDDDKSKSKSAAAPKLRHFPQMASQKLRRRVCTIRDAHGGAPVVAVAGDNSKIVSASAADGTVRAFARTGDGGSGGRSNNSRRNRPQTEGEQLGEYGSGINECLVSMEGFDGGLSSVTFDKSLLACDGMGSTLCLHDFAEIDGPIDAASLDLGGEP